MADHDERKNRHFILGGFTETENFIRPRLKIKQKQVPERDRRRHGTALLSQVEVLKPEMEAAREAQKAIGLDGGFGLRVEFESFPGIELAFESLARERSGIEVLNERYEDNCTYATIFVPDRKLEHFETLIRDYMCLFDTRVNNGHPLIAPSLADLDLNPVEPVWERMMPTAMAGFALAEDLTELLGSGNPIEIGHRLESVKLLPEGGANAGDPRHQVHCKVGAVARRIIDRPRRIFYRIQQIALRQQTLYNP